MSGMKLTDGGGYARTADALMNSKSHMKEYSSANGAGAESDYEDTSEKIKSAQEMAKAKALAHPMKPGYRN